MFRMTQTAIRAQRFSALVDRIALAFKGKEPRLIDAASGSAATKAGITDSRSSKGWRRRRRRRGLAGANGPAIRSTWF